MAVLQISKIQVRRGQELVTGVPQLSAGEFAWSTDVQKLYIGNGSTASPSVGGDGAPTVGNTEILTANSISNGNLFSLESYQYQKNNPVIQTGPTNFPVIRTLQSKLDDSVSAFDFGAKGDGVNDDTKSLQQALTQLYANTDASIASSRKTLRIPAGTYKITGTLFVPPYASIVGDGMDKTIIKQLSTGSAVLQFCGLNAQGVLTTWDAHNISAGRYQPQNISVEGMTIGYDTYLAEFGQQGLLEADCAVDSRIHNVKFEGAGQTPSTVAGIEIRGLGQTTTKNLRISNCIFENLGNGVLSFYDSSEIYISNSEFRNLNVGIDFFDYRSGGNNWPQVAPFASGQVSTVGPQHVLIQSNRFENIYQQAVFVGTNSTNVSTFINSVNNGFFNCGNFTGTEAQQSYEVLGFYTPGNTSVNDYFFRIDENNTTTNASSKILPAVNGPAVYLQGKGVQAITLQPALVVYQPLLTVAKTKTDQVIKLSYVASQSSVGVTRRGDLSIVCNTNNPVITDAYTYIGPDDGQIGFTATVSTLSNALSISALVPYSTTLLEFTYSQLY